jgi:hypothetical protein
MWPRMWPGIWVGTSPHRQSGGNGEQGHAWLRSTAGGRSTEAIGRRARIDAFAGTLRPGIRAVRVAPGA